MRRVAGGGDLSFDPVQSIGPAVEALVDDEVRERRRGIQGAAQRALAGVLREAGRVLPGGKRGRGGPGAGRAEQWVGA